MRSALFLSRSKRSLIHDSAMAGLREEVPNLKFLRAGNSLYGLLRIVISLGYSNLVSCTRAIPFLFSSFSLAFALCWSLRFYAAQNHRSIYIYTK